MCVCLHFTPFAVSGMTPLLLSYLSASMRIRLFIRLTEYHLLQNSVPFCTSKSNCIVYMSNVIMHLQILADYLKFCDSLRRLFGHVAAEFELNESQLLEQGHNVFILLINFLLFLLSFIGE